MHRCYLSCPLVGKLRLVRHSSSTFIHLNTLPPSRCDKQKHSYAMDSALNMIRNKSFRNNNHGSERSCNDWPMLRNLTVKCFMNYLHAQALYKILQDDIENYSYTVAILSLLPI